jgi:hypothetical protein
VSYAVVVRGLAGLLPLEEVRRSSRFVELLPSVNPEPVEFDLGGVVPPVSFGLPDVAGGPRPQGSLGGFAVERPSVVEQGVAAAKASRLGRSAPSLDDWAVAGSGRG